MKLKHECLYTRFNGIDYIGLLENGAEASCMHVEIICEYLMAAYQKFAKKILNVQLCRSNVN